MLRQSNQSPSKALQSYLQAVLCSQAISSGRLVLSVNLVEIFGDVFRPEHHQPMEDKKSGFLYDVHLQISYTVSVKLTPQSNSIQSSFRGRHNVKVSNYTNIVEGSDYGKLLCEDSPLVNQNVENCPNVENVELLKNIEEELSEGRKKMVDLIHSKLNNLEKAEDNAHTVENPGLPDNLQMKLLDSLMQELIKEQCDLTKVELNFSFCTFPTGSLQEKFFIGLSIQSCLKVLVITHAHLNDTTAQKWISAFDELPTLQRVNFSNNDFGDLLLQEICGMLYLKKVSQPLKTVDLTNNSAITEFGKQILSTFLDIKGKAIVDIKIS